MGCTGWPEAVCVGQASCDKSFRQKGRRVLGLVAHSYKKRRGRMSFTDSLINHHWFREWEPRRPKKWHHCEFLWVRNSGLSLGVVTSTRIHTILFPLSSPLPLPLTSSLGSWCLIHRTAFFPMGLDPSQEFRSLKWEEWRPHRELGW